MPTPEKKKDIIEGYLDEVNNIADNVALSNQATYDQLKEAGQTYADAIEASENAAKAAGATAITDITSANSALETSYNDSLRRREEDLAAAQKEDKILTRADNNAAIWTAATEAAAAVANLIGVGSFNAANQKQPSYSQEWMKRADANRRERQKRMDNLKERLDAADLQLANAKAQNAKDLGGLKYKIGLADADRTAAAAKTQYGLDTGLAGARQKGDAAVADVRLKGAGQAAQMRLAKQKGDQQIAAQREAREAALAARGYTKDANGNWTYNGSSTTRKSGTDKSVRFALPASSDGQFSAATVTIKNPENLVKTIVANRAVVDIDEKEMKRIESYLSQGKIDEADLTAIVSKYIPNNPKLRELVKMVADDYEEDIVPPASIARPVEDDDDETGLSLYQ